MRFIAWPLLGVCLLLVSLFALSASAQEPALTPIEELGKALFFDEALSINQNQSCASCHSPAAGWTGPDSAVNAHEAVYQGSVDEPIGLFGNRKPPTAAYGGESPVLYYDRGEGVWVGGMFWDGRATGWTLGDPLAEQAKGPFLNPVEQALPDAQTLCERVAMAGYASLFREVWGKNSLKCNGVGNIEEAYDQIGLSISAYEQSSEVNPFSSKYDAYLNGMVQLDPIEMWGKELYEGKAMCAACHPSEPGPNGEPPLFTDFTYDNLGVPKNLENPFYTMPSSINPDGENWIDPGLGGFLQSAGYDKTTYAAEWGKQKVPTLRNVDKRPAKGFVKAYSHNGYFKSLEAIVHFYNTRDVLPFCEEVKNNPKPGDNCWPKPEVAENVNSDELGNLGLTPAEEKALVAFLKTLSDGYMANPNVVARKVMPASPSLLEHQLFLPAVTTD